MLNYLLSSLSQPAAWLDTDTACLLPESNSISGCLSLNQHYVAKIQWLIFCFLNASILSFCQCRKNLLKVHFRYSGKSVSFMVLKLSITRFMFFFHLKDNRVGLVSVKQKFKESREGSGYPRFVWAASFNSLYISRCLFLSIGKRDIEWLQLDCWK